ncbi:hypothetical protein [Corynebacterium alimapuense]|uniref:Uncharacterized protein n=1 Tax=Corynebacterium alimapuense TaxID=1576874 RepID=A0A3M8K9G0_9CORY|nr:hypothetical protein [Corynebacterium alimapuense]RNE49425.1 hypothetical protein C5L39_03420 [Corynebacterium alimapuense]
MRTISTDLNLLIRPEEWEEIAPQLPAALAEHGFLVDSVHAQTVDLTCEPDNMLVTQYSQVLGRPPIVEVLHRIIVNGSSDMALKDATQAVVATLPEDSYWYGTSLEGVTEPGVNAACAWQHQ